MPQGNPDPNAGSGNPDPKAGAAAGAAAGAGETKWYSTLEGDLATHPAIMKFENPTALAKSYIEVERLTGHEKVVKPKNAEDKAGWARFNEAMGVPKESKEYQFADPKDIPEGLGFDKARFAEVAHKNGLRPDQAEGLWKDYTGEVSSGWNAQREKNDAEFNAAETSLRTEWGAAYDGNIALASKYLKSVTKDAAEFDRLNAKFSADPAAIRILAETGKKFSENSIGGFKGEGGTKLTPEKAQEEYDGIVGNQKDDYYSDVNSVRQRRIKYVESLLAQGADPTKIG